MGSLAPQRNFHLAQQQPQSEVAIRTGPVEDLYVVVTSFDADGAAAIRAFVNPLTWWIWIGAARDACRDDDPANAAVAGACTGGSAQRGPRARGGNEMTLRVLLSGVALVLIFAAPAGAAPEDVANDISAHIMSPYCPGVTLHDCPSDSAVALRDRITQMAAGGMTRAEIMAELESEFGPTIRAVPPASGSGLVAWVLPGVAVLAGIGCAWVLVRRWTGTPAAEDAPVVQRVTAEERRLLDSELGKLRGQE